MYNDKLVCKVLIFLSYFMKREGSFITTGPRTACKGITKSFTATSRCLV